MPIEKSGNGIFHEYPPPPSNPIDLARKAREIFGNRKDYDAPGENDYRTAFGIARNKGGIIGYQKLTLDERTNPNELIEFLSMLSDEEIISVVCKPSLIAHSYVAMTTAQSRAMQMDLKINLKTRLGSEVELLMSIPVGEDMNYRVDYI